MSKESQRLAEVLTLKTWFLQTLRCGASKELSKCAPGEEAGKYRISIHGCGHTEVYCIHHMLEYCRTTAAERQVVCVTCGGVQPFESGNYTIARL